MNYQNELYHFGIKGQKWGVRRYQNPDGTLTEAGKKHYGSTSEQKKLGRLAAEDTNGRLKAAPQVKDAARKMSGSVDRIKQASKKLDKVEEDYYKDADRVKRGIAMQRENILDYYQSIGKKAPKDVLDEKTFRNLSLSGQAEKLYNADSPFKSFINTAIVGGYKWDELSKRYMEANEEYDKACKDYYREVRNYASLLLGNYGNSSYKYAKDHGKRYAAHYNLERAIEEMSNKPKMDSRYRYTEAFR